MQAKIIKTSPTTKYNSTQIDVLEYRDRTLGAVCGISVFASVSLISISDFDRKTFSCVHVLTETIYNKTKTRA